MDWKNVKVGDTYDDVVEDNEGSFIETTNKVTDVKEQDGNKIIHSSSITN